MTFMQSPHGWNQAKTFAASACVGAGRASVRNGAAYFHALHTETRPAPPLRKVMGIGRILASWNSGRFAEYNVQLFESSQQQGAILAQCHLRLLGCVLGRGLGDQHDPAVGPCTRWKRSQLRRNLFRLQNVNLVIGKIDEANPIFAHHQIGILPFAHVADLRIFCRIRCWDRFEPGLLTRFYSRRLHGRLGAAHQRSQKKTHPELTQRISQRISHNVFSDRHYRRIACLRWSTVSSAACVSLGKWYDSASFGNWCETTSALKLNMDCVISPAASP